MHGKWWQPLGLLLLLSLAACNTVGQHTASVPTPTPEPAANNISSGFSLILPAQIASVPSATAIPSATPGAHPTAPVQSGGSLPPLTSAESQLTQQLFALINQDRTSQGNLYAYVLNSAMSSGARLHSWKMANCGLSHQCPGEPAPCQRVSNDGISWTACGENVGYSSPSPTAWAGVQAIEKDMLNEPPPAGHRYNLLNTSYHRIGVGVYIDSRGYVWITEDFAN